MRIYRSVYIAMAAVPREGIVYYEDDEISDDVTTLIRKPARICMDKRIDSKRPHPDLQDILASTVTGVLLRRIYFLNEKRTRYVSVRFYPSDIYQVLTEFGARGSCL